MRSKIVPLCAACLLVSAPLLAQGSGTSAATAPPGPPAQLSELGVLLGSWDCTGTMTPAPGQQHDTAARVKAEMVFGGRWLHLTYEERKTAANPAAIAAGMYLGYDPVLQKFVFGGVDSRGGYSTETSPGWSADTLAFEGIMNAGGRKIPVRDTFEKKGAQIVHARAFQGPDGAFGEFERETCTKRR